MDISLNSSAILVVIVGLWLVWVVPYFLRRHGTVPVHESGVARSLPAVIPPSRPEESSSQGNILENTSKPTSSTTSTTAPPSGGGGSQSSGLPAEARSGNAPSSNSKPFKIRYGRTGLAAVGAIALVVALVGTVVSVAGLAPAFIPILSVLVAVGSVATLRTLAVRDRNKRSAERVEAAFRQAMNPGVTPARDHGHATGLTADSSSVDVEPQQSAPKRETKLFDAQNPGNDGSAPEAKGTASTATAAPSSQQQLTAVELRQAALAVAAEAEPGESAETESAGSGEAGTASAEPGQTWEPVDVPKPKYVESAKADRPTPEPLELPAGPKPEGKPSIKAGAVAPKVEMQLDQEALEQTVQKAQENTPAAAKKAAGHFVAGPSQTSAAADKGKPSGGLHDLDNVLQRRRA